MVEALARYDELRDRVGLGPAAEQALGVVQEVIDSEPGFVAVHFPDVKARYVQVEVPKDLLPAAEGEAAPKEGGDRGGGGAPTREEAIQARIPVVLLTGSVQTLEKPPATVFADFTEALKAAVARRLPRARLEMDRGLRGNKNFEIQIRFFSGWRPIGR